jgi:hypothetical protein
VDIHVYVNLIAIIHYNILEKDLLLHLQTEAACTSKKYEDPSKDSTTVGWTKADMTARV